MGNYRPTSATNSRPFGRQNETLETDRWRQAAECKTKPGKGWLSKMHLKGWNAGFISFLTYRMLGLTLWSEWLLLHAHCTTCAWTRTRLHVNIILKAAPEMMTMMMQMIIRQHRGCAVDVLQRNCFLGLFCTLDVLELGFVIWFFKVSFNVDQLVWFK